MRPEDQDAMGNRLVAIAKQMQQSGQQIPVLDRERDPYEWRAWEAWFRREYPRMAAFMKTRQKMTVIRELPPADADGLREIEAEIGYHAGGLRDKLRRRQAAE